MLISTRQNIRPSLSKPKKTVGQSKIPSKTSKLRQRRHSLLFQIWNLKTHYTVLMCKYDSTHCGFKCCMVLGSYRMGMHRQIHNVVQFIFKPCLIRAQSNSQRHRVRVADLTWQQAVENGFWTRKTAPIQILHWRPLCEDQTLTIGAATKTDPRLQHTR